MEIERDGDLGRVREMIAHGVLAGAYRVAARETPTIAGGWLRMAATHTARAATLADEIFEDATLAQMALTASSTDGGLPSGGWGGPASRGF